MDLLVLCVFGFIGAWGQCISTNILGHCPIVFSHEVFSFQGKVFGTDAREPSDVPNQNSAALDNLVLMISGGKPLLCELNFTLGEYKS